jgi:hypothetical protein
MNNNEFRKCLVVVLIKAQKAIIFSGYGIVYINLQTFVVVSFRCESLCTNNFYFSDMQNNVLILHLFEFCNKNKTLRVSEHRRWVLNKINPLLHFNVYVFPAINIPIGTLSLVSYLEKFEHKMFTL